MKISNSIKVAGLGVLAAGLVSLSFGRVGPVSQYGQLQAGTNANGKGQIYGSCPTYSTSGHEVQVRGMSLYWSSGEAASTDFYTEAAINTMVRDMNIEIVRFAMGISEGWDNGRGYLKNGKDDQKKMLKAVVEAAIANDIYVIIDWHSHQAENQTDAAVEFFSWAAQTYGGYNNVIFEVYNEPIGSYGTESAVSYWPTIKGYAEKVIEAIRKHSDNLVLVGTPYYDQYPNAAKNSKINDKNVAYTFHYYAASHSTGNEGSNALDAMNNGLSVFVSEWGTGSADGAGSVASDASNSWQEWMNKHKLSSANWSASKIGETTAAFTGGSTSSNLEYTESGRLVKSYFANNPTSYTACSGLPVSSSSEVVSSSSNADGTTDFIDDFEDGDSLSFTGGVWYAYNDANDEGKSTISNKVVVVDGEKGYDVVIDADNGSSYMAGMTGIVLDQGDNKYAPYVALGVKLNDDESDYDLSSCKTISYKYKGATHNFKVELSTVTNYNYHFIEKAESGEWKQVSMDFDDLSQSDWGDLETHVDLSDYKKNINKLTWEVKGVANKTTQPSYNYLYVDDVRCNGLSIKPVQVTSSSSVNSSSSQSSSSVSSSSVASSSSAKSSSSVASSSSQSSSSVASSSSVSSSSVASSSSQVIVESSSSNVSTGVVVSGKLNQTVTIGSAFETVTFSNVTSFNRKSWNLYFVEDISLKNGKVVVAGTVVPTYFQPGSVVDTLVLNGEEYSITLDLVAGTESSNSSASVESSSSSSEEHTTFVQAYAVNPLKVSVAGRMLQITGADVVQVEVFDMQGSPVASFRQVAGSVSLEKLRQGNYIVRVRSGSMSLTRRVSIK